MADAAVVTAEADLVLAQTAETAAMAATAGAEATLATAQAVDADTATYADADNPASALVADMIADGSASGDDVAAAISANHGSTVKRGCDCC